MGLGDSIDDRRRASRHTAGWTGFCHVEGEEAAGWRDCRIVDISLLGLGLRMQHPKPDDLMGRRISVDLPAIGEAVNIHFEGVVKNVERATLRSVRIGIEFVQPSSTERAILEALRRAGEATGLPLTEAAAGLARSHPPPAARPR